MRLKEFLQRFYARLERLGSSKVFSVLSLALSGGLELAAVILAALAGAFFASAELKEGLLTLLASGLLSASAGLAAGTYESVNHTPGVHAYTPEDKLYVWAGSIKSFVFVALVVNAFAFFLALFACLLVRLF